MKICKIAIVTTGQENFDGEYDLEHKDIFSPLKETGESLIVKVRESYFGDDVREVVTDVKIPMLRVRFYTCDGFIEGYQNIGLRTGVHRYGVIYQQCENNKKYKWGYETVGYDETSKYLTSHRDDPNWKRQLLNEFHPEIIEKEAMDAENRQTNYESDRVKNLIKRFQNSRRRREKQEK